MNNVINKVRLKGSEPLDKFQQPNGSAKGGNPTLDGFWA